MNHERVPALGWSVFETRRKQGEELEPSSEASEQLDELVDHVVAGWITAEHLREALDTCVERCFVVVLRALRVGLRIEAEERGRNNGSFGGVLGRFWHRTRVVGLRRSS